MIGWENGKRTRPEKGKSLVILPLDYTVVDIETTGLDRYCSVIEASALRVKDGEVTAEFSSLIRPPKLELYRGGEWVEGYVNDFIIGLTGITDDMLESAPGPEEVLPRLAEFLGDGLLMGHNVPFDVNFLYDAFVDTLGQPLRNDYVDTLRVSRKLLPHLPHHRLSDLAAALGVSYEGAHRSLADCRITHACYLKLRERALENGTEEEFSRSFGKRKSGEKMLPRLEADKNHPLYRKRVCFVGKLHSMSRREAKELVAKLGGIGEDSVTEKTDYLVIASAPVDLPKGRKASAAPLTLQGGRVVVLSEAAFLNLVRGKWKTAAM